MPSLILGSAQFGMPYGATNDAGQVPSGVVSDLLVRAATAGVDFVDTAANYGEAESVIGSSDVPVRVGTKVAFRDETSLRDQIERSKYRLRHSRLEQVLLHDWCDLSIDEKSQAAKELEDIRNRGIIERCGVSIYSEGGLIDAATLFHQLDAVQLPVNALDRRFAAISRDMRNEMPFLRIEGRSILLQGLLAEKAGPELLQSHPCIERWHTWCFNHDLSPVAAALSFSMTQGWLDCIVVGVTSVGQLNDVLRFTTPAVECLRVGQYVTDLVAPCADDALIDPRRWTKPK